MLRLPFRFGVVTLTQCPQAFVRARIELADGVKPRAASGRDDGAEVVRQEPGAVQRGQLRPAARGAALARDAYLADGACAHSPRSATSTRALRRARRLAGRRAARPQPADRELRAAALIDRAVLDALCRALGVSFYAGDARRTCAGIGRGAPDARPRRLRLAAVPAPPRAGTDDRGAPHRRPGRRDHRRRSAPCGERRPAGDAGGRRRALRPPLLQAEGRR